MKVKELMLGAVAVGAMAGNAGAVDPSKAGLSLDDPMFMERVATCRGGPLKLEKGRAGARGKKRVLCPDPPNGFTGERVAVKHVTKKVCVKYKPEIKAVDLDEYAKQLAGNRVAVKKTVKKVSVA